MADIQFEIQGQDAVAATEELLSTSGLTGDWTVAVEDKTSKEAVITTVATIVGIVGGTIAIAEQIRKWYQDYKKVRIQVNRVERRSADNFCIPTEDERHSGA